MADEGGPAHLIRCHRAAEAIIAWRARDRDDIRSILEAGVEFDRDFLDRWVVAWDLTDRWSTFG